jgi:hypothetical protein
MTREPSENPTATPTPEEILERARRRGEQIKLHRRIATGFGAAALAAAIVVPLSVSGAGQGQRLVQVAGQPTTSQPSTSTSTRTQVTEPYSPTIPVSHNGGTTVGTSPVPVAVSSPTTATTGPGGTTSVPSGPTTMTVTDSNNGQTITLAVGSTLIVKLGADNWTIAPASQPAVLAMQGTPQNHPTPCGYPGGTCGTTTATFRAEQPGVAQVSASRTYCGEAIRCNPGAPGSWSITVQVVG